MKIIIVLILSLFFYPPLTTQDSTVVKNQVICNIAGSVWTSTYVFDINQLPERCDIITIGQYAFNRDDGTNTRITESDKGVIRTLIEANKPVYTRIGFLYKDDWSSIFDPPDADVFQKKIFDPLVNFLNTFKVNGILINCEDIYNVDIDDFAQKMSNFVSAIKGKVDKLIVGLIIYGGYYEKFPDNTLFDFSITNKVLDLYIIDWSVLNDCEEDKTKTDMTPVTSTTPNTTTIEQVTCGVTSSCMDKSKIYALIQMLPVIPENLVPEGAKRISTYSIYCAIPDQASSSQWCTSPSKMSYDQGVHAKKFYVGIVLQQLDTDDYESKCECGPFPVSNTIIDGWTGCPFKNCRKLDRN
ncbi:uncharacterized protein LOC132940746 [Metopolophium dirhodum]|uniref:uncharacterized protein LOC132940746 n=1 Tax=Metopolophium dirhodum TaxID=44670 RepID=UPI00298F7CA9|nr:uncharacterized protein LOC132940746 [Metopolophium dirhodum]